jgi:hypothetical protein
MRTKSEKTSSGAQEHRAAHSVYDFFYQDSRRVGSLLAQFYPEGLLQSIKRVEGLTQGSIAQESREGNLTVAVASGKMSSEEGWSQGSSDQSERTFDPLWQNAVTLLTFLQDKSYLQRSLEQARLGQTIMVSGSLQVFDMALLLGILSDGKSLQRLFQLFGETSKKGSAGPKTKAFDKAEVIGKLLTHFPVSTQAILRTPKSWIWSSLKTDCLESRFADIYLKYGTRVAGTWSMLAILDCLPDEPDSSRVKAPEGEMEHFMDLAERLDQLSRHVGRPNNSFGVTPILIFREVELAGGSPP